MLCQTQFITVYTIDSTILLSGDEIEKLSYALWLYPQPFPTLPPKIDIKFPTKDVKRFLDRVIFRNNHYEGIETTEIRDMIQQLNYPKNELADHEFDDLVNKIKKHLQHLVYFYNQIAMSIGMTSEKYRTILSNCFAYNGCYRNAFE